MGSQNASAHLFRQLVRDLDEVLASATGNGATAIHLFPGEPPAARVNGRLTPLPFPPVSREQAAVWRRSLAPLDGCDEAERIGCGPTVRYSGPDGTLFRGRFLGEKAGGGMVLFPLLPPPEFDPRAAPPALRHLANLRGLVLLTGGVGAGKTTLLASLVTWLGSTESWRIVALEQEPARFFYPAGQGWIGRWEIPRSSSDMARVLSSPFTRDADSIAVDPLRNISAIRAALELAESGKLVLATYEAEGAAAAVASLVDAFPDAERKAGAKRLAATLRLVLCQTLPRRVGGMGVVVLREALPVHPAVASSICTGALGTLAEFVQVGPEAGSRLDDALWRLYQAGDIDADEAIRHARDKERFLARLDAADSEGPARP